MNAYCDSWRRFADFSGRTCRRDYWVACFTGFGVHFLYFIFCMVLCLAIAGFLELSVDQMSSTFRILSSLYSTAYLLPYLAMTVRRLRDAGYHSKLLVLWIIPPVGFLAILARLCSNSVEAEAVFQNP